MESVFAAVSACLLDAQALIPNQWVGCALILVGMLISEIKGKNSVPGKTSKGFRPKFRNPKFIKNNIYHSNKHI